MRDGLAVVTDDDHHGQQILDRQRYAPSSKGE